MTDFGAFVDIGVHQDGLVHLSQICDRYIRHPSEEVKVGDVVAVLEAMKMDNEIESEFDGQVVAVEVSEGDTVTAGAVILTIG